MQILISPAKTMADTCQRMVKDATEPQYEAQAKEIAKDMAQYSVDELMHILNISRQIAVETYERYRSFGFGPGRIPAIFAYDGIVFKKMDPGSMNDSDLAFAQEHLNIASPLYGMLRPLDLISGYRLESGVRLPMNGSEETMLQFWKPIMTEMFIKKVKDDDGLLVNLASNEYTGIVDWKRVCREVRVISPRFMVDKNGRLSSLTVYAKMNRGAMTRFLITNRADSNNIDSLITTYAYEGFTYRESPDDSPLFVL